METINSNNFKFSAPLAMRWNDLDALGHVNNVYYFEYFQIGRGIYMPAVSKGWDWNKNMFLIAHIECDYYKELTIRAAKPTIKIRTSSIYNKSFEIEYLITSTGKDGEEIIHAKGKSTQVFFDVAEKKSVIIPDWLRKELIEYEPALN